MEGKYFSVIQSLIKEQETTDPFVFSTKVAKVKSQMKQRIFEIRKEIDRISYKTTVINSAKEKDVPEISRENETILFLSALSLFYQSKIQILENENKRFGDLKNFEEEIIQKYNKQNERLQKLRQYSQKIKEKLEKENKIRNERREQREKEAEEVLKKYEIYLQAEKRYDFNSRMQKSREDLLKIENEIQEESKKNISLISKKEAMERKRKELEDEIESFSATVESKESRIEEEKEKLVNNNKETSERIDKMRAEINKMKDEILEFDAIIECANKLQPFIEEAKTFNFDESD